MRLDGREITAEHSLVADFVVVGSGPAGSACARTLARGGADVLVVEAGRWFEPRDFPESAFEAMADLYRDMSASIALGPAPLAVLQAKMVGGSSPINGAICWRLPREPYDDWVRADPALAEALPWADLEALTDGIEARLNVRPTDPEIAGRKSDLMAAGADALGLEHRPIRRNVVGCEGLGRCIQGCPNGRKASVDRTLLTDAIEAGARVLSSVEVTRVVVAGGRAGGVLGLAQGGGGIAIRARSGVVLAASAVQSPALLMRSGIDDGPVGRHFQAHPGLSVAGHFAEPVHNWVGATQCHEVIGLRHERLKFETLGFGMGVLATRLGGVGAKLAREIDQMAHVTDWGVAVRAEAEGRVRLVAGKPVVTYAPTAADIGRFRRGVRVLGEMLLAAGAEHVALGVRGFQPTTSAVADLVRLEREGPRHGAAFSGAMTHMFGTCRMGSDPSRAVVRPDFGHHAVDRLWVADSSVFPSNIGVNPQIPIMAVAAHCGRRILDTERAPRRRAPRPLSLDDLMRMDARQLHRVMLSGHPLDPAAVAGRQFLGVDLSLPELGRKLLWHTFRKAFVRDGERVRGWNVRMQQSGVDGVREPLLDRAGSPVTFGHYVLRSALGKRFPKGWRGADYLDYGVAGNLRRDPAALGYTPIVAVNAGDQSLLLGWEIFKVGPKMIPFPLYWALRDEGPLEHVVDPPRAPR